MEPSEIEQNINKIKELLKSEGKEREKGGKKIVNFLGFTVVANMEVFHIIGDELIMRVIMAL